jgi:PhoD-like phosphatase
MLTRLAFVLVVLTASVARAAEPTLLVTVGEASDSGHRSDGEAADPRLGAGISVPVRGEPTWRRGSGSIRDRTRCRNPAAGALCKAHDSWSNADVLGSPEDNGTGFAVERDAILRAFRERGVQNVAFLAADVHHAELIRHHPTPEWSFHEFIAGPLSASLGRPRPLDMGLNPRSLFAMADAENFGEVSIDPTGLTVRIIDVSGGCVSRIPSP